MSKVFLHEIDGFADFVDVVASEQRIDPGLVEKDYWIMHALWGLQHLGMHFELKGGTSLSKGFGLIDRFSEDIDILIQPDDGLPIGKNHNKSAHIEARRDFYDGLPARLALPGFAGAERDRAFDNDRMWSAGIRLSYPSVSKLPDGVKAGILLEAGFDKVTPNRPCVISSWAYDKAVALDLEDVIDNRALDVPCYEPGYTLVEKLQTISTKYRGFQARGDMPQNFLRHYYDVYCLLEDGSVQAFIATDNYLAHKQVRFPAADDKNIVQNEAFHLRDQGVRQRFELAYQATRALYYRGQPPLSDILARIEEYADRL